jgi:hypothetical protein
MRRPIGRRYWRDRTPRRLVSVACRVAGAAGNWAVVRGVGRLVGLSCASAQGEFADDSGSEHFQEHVSEFGVELGAASVADLVEGLFH